MTTNTDTPRAALRTNTSFNATYVWMISAVAPDERAALRITPL